MKQDKLKKIEAKIKSGLSLTKKEKAFYILFSPALDLEVVNAAIKI